jgi:hypothetical protein
MGAVMINLAEAEWAKASPPPTRNSIAHALDLANIGPSKNRRALLASTLNPEQVIAVVRAQGDADWSLRCSRLQRKQDPVALAREVLCSAPSFDQQQHPEWALLELELNMRIRPEQAELALRMIRDGANLQINTMHQLFMGEGKTSVILPMLAVALADGKSLARITLLSALINSCRVHLRHVLGGGLGPVCFCFELNKTRRRPGSTHLVLSIFS